MNNKMSIDRDYFIHELANICGAFQTSLYVFKDPTADVETGLKLITLSAQKAANLQKVIEEIRNKKLVRKTSTDEK